MMLLNLPLSESVIVDGGDSEFVMELKSYSETVTGTAE